MSDTDKKIREDGLEQFGRYYGLYKGKVYDNEDPKNLGRLIVTVPQIYGDDIYEYWALPKGLYAGKSKGSFFIPDKDDFVWIQFENGDPRFPVWDYGWWGDNQVPDTATTKRSILQTKSGHRLIFDDESEEIIIENSKGHKVTLHKNGIELSHSSDIEQAVRGNTCVSLLNEMLSDLGNLSAISTSSGVTYAIKTSPMWSTFAAKWKDKFNDFLSNEVKLE